MATTPTSNTPTPEPVRRAPVSRPTAVAADGRGPQGGSGVQRSHLRNRKQWLRKRRRHGLSWAARKVASNEYCVLNSFRR